MIKLYDRTNNNCDIVCVGVEGKVVDVKKEEVLVKVGDKKHKLKANPAVSLKKGDKVMIFKDYIIDRIG